MEQIINKKSLFSLLFLLIIPFISYAGSQYDPDFPDVIYCYLASPDQYVIYNYHSLTVSGGSFANSRSYFDPYNYEFMQYKSDGTVYNDGPTSDCDTKSISQLYADGQAFDFGTGSSTPSSSSGNSTTTIEVNAGSDDGVFGMGIMMVILFVMFSGYIWNKAIDRKPWKK
jgi:hypothetical protein